jgi:hypothetical protein
LGILEILGKVRGVHQQFLGHTATDHAGAAVTVLFANAHPRAVPRGNPRGANTAGTSADHKQVEIVVSHEISVSL